MRWQFSAMQWDVLTELLRLEGYPSPITVQVHGRTDLERGRIRAQAGAELTQLGLERAGQVEPDLEATIRLLHRPACWVDSVWLPAQDAGRPVRVVAARHGTTGVCAVQRPEEPGATVLEVIPADGLAAAVVSKLPAHPPGTSPAATVALGSNATPDRPGLLVSASTTRTSTERDNAAAAAILERSHTRAGQIAANVREPSGRVRRSEVLRWCDNPDGRYLVAVSSRPDGPASLTVGPTDVRRLGDAVHRLLASVQPG